MVQFRIKCSRCATSTVTDVVAYVIKMFSAMYEIQTVTMGHFIFP